MLWIMLAAFGGPMIVSILATRVVRSISVRRGFIDRPGGHKQHDRPVALGGGVALYATVAACIVGGTLAALLAARLGKTDWLPPLLAMHLEGVAKRLPSVLGILAAALVLHVVGLIDDRRPLGPWSKFAAQAAVAFFTSGVLGIRIMEGFLPAPLSVAATVLWIVVITNAFNFLDNMDGLSAGVGAVASLVFAIAALSVGQIFVPALALVLAGALCGFLVFNFHPATIFMGDAGSLPLGFLMSVLTILTTYYDPRKDLTPLGIVVPLVVLAVPLYDVLSVVIHRLRLGVSPLRGDRRHFSHRLVRKGLSVRGAVLTIYLATAATGLSAVVLPRVSWGGAVLLLVQCLCVLVMVAILEHAPGRNGGTDPAEVGKGKP